MDDCGNDVMRQMELSSCHIVFSRRVEI